MKQVDFYLISNRVKQGQYKLASRLAKKLQSMQQSSLMVVDTPAQLDELDGVLWNFSDTSFVAHDRVPHEGSAMSKTHLTTVDELSSELLSQQYDVLVSLTSDVQTCCHHFDRVAEIIEAEEPAKSAGRERYRRYQAEGFEIKTHHLEL